MRLTENDFPKEENTVKNHQTDSNLNHSANENPFAEDALATVDMSFREKRRYQKKILKQRLSTMDKNERKKYIFQYYKGYMIGAVCLILFICFALQFIYKATIPTDLTVMIANENTAQPSEYIKQTFQEYNHLDTKHNVFITTGITLEEIEADYDQNGMISRQRLWASIRNDEIDVLIGDQKCLDFVSTSEDITELDKSLDSDLYEQIKDKCVTAVDKNGGINEGKPFVAAIDISNTEFAKNCGLSYDTVYLMLPSNRYQNNEASMQLIRTIFKL